MIFASERPRSVVFPLSRHTPPVEFTEWFRQTASCRAEDALVDSPIAGDGPRVRTGFEDEARSVSGRPQPPFGSYGTEKDQYCECYEPRGPARGTSGPTGGGAKDFHSGMPRSINNFLRPSMTGEIS